ncbi:MAG: cysteine dioxygenase family protein [Rhodospirillaceae bacterium]|nr:cysteine dioxygenase family protein [Rhodospirillaceae bacterium]
MDATSSTSDRRRRLVADAIAAIRVAMDGGPSLDNLARGKARLIELAGCREFFTFEDFPLPDDDAMECSYLVHEDEDGGYALYVNSGAAHQYYAPHDHGNAWAIIAGVEGRERHRFYQRRADGEPGAGPVVEKGEVIVAAGGAVTMQPDGIHEVNAMDGKPLLHLHLYARNFVLQGERWKYDPDTGMAEPFHLDELGSIIDAR